METSAEQERQKRKRIYRKKMRKYEFDLYDRLVMFGDYIAKDQRYEMVEGLEAVRFYVMERHHWLPRDVLNMSLEELDFATRESQAKMPVDFDADD